MGEVKDADEFRALLREAAERRRELQRELEATNRRIAELAIASKGILSREEVGRIVGVTRVAVQKLIAWHQGSASSRH